MPQETLSYHPEIRAREDFITWGAEVIDGRMLTPTEYVYDMYNNELIASDGSVLGDIFEDSVSDAEQKVSTNSQLGFELRRRKIEQEEYNEMLVLMQNTEDVNTMIIVSDFPSELMNCCKDVGGYNVTRKQAFLRVIQREGNILKMFSHTLDGSNREALESIFSSLGYEAQQGELLGQRITINTDVDARALVDSLVNVYDDSLFYQTGDIYSAGIKKGNVNINTYEFMTRQHDIVAYAVRNAIKNGNNSMYTYDIAAVLWHRYEEAKRGIGRIIPMSMQNTAGIAIQSAMFYGEMQYIGNQARSQGRPFSACGLTLSSSGDINAKKELSSAGYSIEDSDNESYSFDSYQFCVRCQAPPKEEERKKMCGPCGLCRDCDRKAG